MRDISKKKIQGIRQTLEKGQAGALNSNRAKMKVPDYKTNGHKPF
jgi:hypothetical protein